MECAESVLKKTIISRLSTGRQRFFHMFSTIVRVRRLFTAVTVALAVCWITAAPQAQGASASLFRIFLSDGTSLVSYGEFARVADRVVFSVPLGEGPEPKLHLVSIPESTVDWTRTDEYTLAVRAKRYADTRGEQDFVMLTGQVTAALNDIALAPDPKRRVAMAEEARRNLAAWPAANHGYRAADVAQLVGMLDDVVAEMRIAAGGNQFDLSLVATSTPPPMAALIPPPDVRGSLEAAYRAALLAGDPDERIALLRTLTQELAFAPASATWAPVLRVRASAALLAELRVENAYGELVKNTLKRAAERAVRADVRGLQQIIAQALSHDDRLGRRRSGQMTGLLAALDLRLDEARRIRLARDSWAMRLEEFKTYRDAVRKPRQRIAGLRKWLEHIRDLSGPDPALLPKLEAHASLALREFAAVPPPAGLQAPHGLFVASVHLIHQAVSLRRSAISTKTLKLAWDASAAASGALTLATHAQDELTRLIAATEETQKEATEETRPQKKRSH